MKKALLVIILLVGGITAYGYLIYGTTEFVPEVRTTLVTQGDIVDTVGATGTLEAVTTVSVGSQVSGIIEELSVDFNSIVRAGDVIMRLDPSLFQTQVAQARANLVRAEADNEGLKVSLDDAQTQLTRAEDLASRQLISETELEAAQLAVRSTEANLKSSQAAITQALASLNQNEVNLEHTVIRAPIDGIVISRLVDAGQTVAASLQTPELFVLAADLTKMRVIANIDESDVGRIRPNQRATFTVDAYPDEDFKGIVSQIRLEPVVTQNVVTYATVIDAPNPDLRLKPGMTATIVLETARRQNVLRIPNTALRFRPTNEMFAVLGQPTPGSIQAVGSANGTVEATLSPTRPYGEARGVGAVPSAGRGFAAGRSDGALDPERRRQVQERLAQMTPEERERFRARRAARRNGASRGSSESRPSGDARQPANVSGVSNLPAVERGATTIDGLFGPLPVTESIARVWVVENGRLQGIDVRLGMTDGLATELLSGVRRGSELEVGAALVTSVTTPDNGPSSSSSNSRSPLIPQFGRRR